MLGAVVFLCTAAAVFAGQKVKVAPEHASGLLSAGGRLVSDYGSFQVLEVDMLPAGLASDPEIEILETTKVKLNSGVVDTSARVALRLVATPGKGKRLHLVQFDGPVRGEWLEGLRQVGFRVVSYVPENAYLVQGDAQALGKLDQQSASLHVQWHGVFQPDQKVLPEPAASLRSLQTVPAEQVYAVQILQDPELNTATLAILNGFSRTPVRGPDPVLDYYNVVISLTAAERDLLATQPDVVSIQPYYERKRFCERQSQIVAGNLTSAKPTGPGYLEWLASKGFSQAQFALSDFVVDIADSGVDVGTSTPTHPGLYVLGQAGGSSRIAYNYLVGSPNSGSTLAGCDGHGTLNAHIVAGYNDRSGFPFRDAGGFSYGLGVCPFVKVGSSVIFDPDFFTSPRLTDLQARAYHNKARISNNSWGGGSSGRYDVDAQETDALVRDAQPAHASIGVPGNQEMVIVVAAGNDGPNTRTIGSPATAKNVITVGASESVQSIGGLDGSDIGDSQANNANDIVAFTSRGPCDDNRSKPDLVAPGTHVSGGVAQAWPAAPTGTADGCFTGDGVSGGINGSLFFPALQELYTASSGTSHAAPAVSGAAALLRQFFINRALKAPSPAMTKAWLMNSAAYMTGALGNDKLPSNTQGMGRIDLGAAFNDTPRVFRDQQDLFVATGQTREFTLEVWDSALPLLVTLAWTDAPGSTIGPAYNNNLDLTVTANGVKYKGNVFNGRWSVAGGSADARNNVESIYLPAGLSGQFTVTVTAANIVADGVPQNATPLDQDFALVVYNAGLDAKPQIEAAGTTLVGETAPSNGAIDPGEKVTVAFALRNVGTVATTNLIATLLAGDAIYGVSEAQTFGKLNAGGAQVQKAFTFQASGACGTSVVATLRLQDGAQEIGRAKFDIALGKRTERIGLAENFDTVTPPALPSSWSRSRSGAGLPWVVTTSKSQSAPAAAFADEALDPGQTELISPSLLVGSGETVLKFKSEFNIEAHDVDVSKSFDGAVLEARVAGAAWTDILESGGVFLSGGYTHTIDPETDNPLPSRRAWAGNSVGFSDVQVLLPAAWAGQNVQFRWVLATDTGNFYGGTGWYIDSISVSEAVNVCQSFAIAPTLLNPHQAGQSLVFSFPTVPGQSYTVEQAMSPDGGNWYPLSTHIGTGSTITVTNPIVGPSVFFRTRSP